MADATHPPREIREGDRGRLVAFRGEHPGSAGSSNNLPLELSSFVGREQEIAEVKRLLGGDRLLTLTGPGGSGKTRLALAVASEVGRDFEDGAWLVELASLSDSGLVPQAVASVLGVRETPGIPLLGTLCDYLGSKEILLLMDNCEHLIDACASLVEVLLRSCTRLRILATSREVLCIPGEIQLVVPPLSLPDPHHLPATESLPRYEAARLFLERARAVKPDFEITEQNAMAFAQICYRLDGIPLAIELAAPRVKVLSVEQISSRLDDRFKLLTGGGRTALPRQRTLRAAMDWGHELLSEEERILFRRLSVFVGGFTLEAAEAVGAGEGLDRDEILEVLSHLVDKSLVMMREEGGRVRYRLLETVRQYGHEKLEKSGEAKQVRKRHAEHYLAHAEGAEPELKGPPQVAWLKRLEEDHDNLRVAIQWSLGQGESEMALRLTASAAPLRYPRGYLTEARRELEAALTGAAGPPAARAKALTEAGFFALEQSDFDEAQRLLEESLVIYQELGDKYGVAHALECLVVAKTRLSDYGRANQLQEESLALYRDLGHKWGIAMSLTNLGILAQKQGEYERATELHLESLELLRVVGDEFTIGYVLSLLGQNALMQGHLERSAALLEESQSLLRKLSDKPNLATTLCNLGETVFRQGDGARATVLYRESLALAVEVGSKATVADCLEGLAEVALIHEQLPSAAQLWGAAEAMREIIGLPLSPRARTRLDYEDQLSAAHSQLGKVAWTASWSEGRAMSPEEAIEYALKPPPAPEEKGPASPPSYPSGLSAREVEVLKHVARGMTNAQIAKELFISPRTVNAHLGSVYHKIGSSTRAEAIRFASEHHLL